MHSRTVWISSFVFVILAGALVSPQPVEAQVDLGGATRVSFSGSLTGFEDPTNLQGNMLAGVTRISEGGAEFGGQLTMNVNKASVSGFGFFHAGYNFIGESLTVPFVSGGVGSPLGQGIGDLILYNASGGVKRFVSERASFDVTGSYQGYLTGDIGSGGNVVLLFGMSLYFD